MDRWILRANQARKGPSAQTINAYPRVEVPLFCDMEPFSPHIRLRQNTGIFVMAKAQKTTSSRRPTRTRSPRRQAAGKAPKTSGARPSAKRWSQRVTQRSDALDLKRGVFTLADPKRIAASLKRSAEHSSRRKAGAYRSALSMLTFYINRAGRNLSKTQRARLDRAKTELKRQFGKDV